MKPRSLMRRLDAWFTAHPGAGMSLTEACERFGCTPKQWAKAVEHANRIFGLGLGSEPFYRLGPTKGARPPRKWGNSHQIRPAGTASSIFHAPQPPRIKIGASASSEPALTVVERQHGLVKVRRIAPQETEEWQERERARRARQKPPRPAANAKTRGKKLLQLIGEAPPEE